ncbi:MAG: high mobility group box domain-containing protein [Benjaminiella poitrasii]|nr:MAG: high mobility group box domain-containing protein [Benjaminiella poitrasii]
MTFANSNTSISQPKVIDPKQWEKDVSRTAIIINEKIDQNHDLISTNQPSDDHQTLTHIVSPEAIREALKEETEEAMGKSKNRPFSRFASFRALKEREHPLINSPPSSVKTNGSSDDDLFGQEKKLKRPPNAYLLFNKDMRRKLLEQSPKMTVAEISKEVGDWWKALPNDKRQYYVEKASLLKEEHLRKHPDFIYTRRSKAELAEAKKVARIEELDDDNDDTSTLLPTISNAEPDLQMPRKRSRKFISTDSHQRDPRGRKKKRHKHPFAPKHPMSAYLYFLASVYPQVSLKFPGSTVGPISKSISRTWHAMTPEEQLPWKQKAESDKARYAQEMRIYMANQKDIIKASKSPEKNNQVLPEEEDIDAQMLTSVVNMVNKSPTSGNQMYHSL